MPLSFNRALGAVLLFSLCCRSATVLAAADGEATCASCHAEQARAFSDSVHARAALACQDCHGGEDVYQLPKGQLGGPFDHGPEFKGKASRLETPERCATCHSDVARMNPYGLPADQLARYRTSGHGKALYENNDTTVAICTDCHDVHAVYRSSDPRSWTNPRNVPATCGRCHGDAKLMAKSNHSVDIMREYELSVHGRGLLENHDTAMPSCATCHGNHAAAPPGVANVDAVCARCHTQTEQFFLKSPHGPIDSFPRCLACHGGRHGHDIQRHTVSPTILAAEYARLSATLDGERLTEALHPGLSAIRESCYDCHDEDTEEEVFQTSEQLYSIIAGAEQEYARVFNHVNETGRGLLLVEDELLLMDDAKTALIELSTTQHSLNVEELEAVNQRLRETTAQVEASLQDKEAGLAWRHQVLLPMWAFIILFSLASYIRYRQLKRLHVKPLDMAREGVTR